MGASLLIHALREIKGPLTMNSVRTYFEQMRDYHFKGLVLTFTPQSRQLQNTVWLDEGNGKIIAVPHAEADFWKKFGKKKEEQLGRTVSGGLGAKHPYLPPVSPEPVRA